METSIKKTRHGDYVQMAHTLRDKLDGLIALGALNLKTQRKILLDVSQELTLVLANNASHQNGKISTCTQLCCEYHEQIMNPSLWSTLATELVQHVFAKLPILDICRLKSLSKEWQSSLQSPSSEFTHTLKESSCRMLARVTWGRYSNFELHLLDGRNNRWHELDTKLEVGSANRRLIQPSESKHWVHMNGATDGGLVCFVFKDSNTCLNCIFVSNPMTGVVYELPTLKVLMYSELNMMRIVVDRKTFHYKVIVVKQAPSVEAEVFDSEVGQWTKPKPSLGCIFGITHYWNRHRYRNEYIWSAQIEGPCAYDCRDGKFYDFEQDQEKWSAREVISYTFIKDRLFVLYWEEGEFKAFISEYSVPENATSWEKEKTHDCSAWCFRRLDKPGLTCRIHAWNGFLFVFLEGHYGYFIDAAAHKKQEYGWVYNLSTCKWLALLNVPWWSTRKSDSSLTNVLCEVHWSIRP